MVQGAVVGALGCRHEAGFCFLRFLFARFLGDRSSQI